MLESELRVHEGSTIRATRKSDATWQSVTTEPESKGQGPTQSYCMLAFHSFF